MFYDNLKAICDKKNIKITPLVVECGGTKGVIGGWKKGAAPNSDIVIKLSVRLNVPTDDLLFGEGKSSSEQLSTDEQELLHIYKELSSWNKPRLLERGQALLDSQNPNIQTAYVAARSSNNELPKIIEGDFSDVLNATDITDKY